MLERGSSELPQDPQDQDIPANKPKVKQPDPPAVPSLSLQAQNRQHLVCHQRGFLSLSLVSASAIPTSLEPILALDNLTLHQARSDGVPSPSFLVPAEKTQMRHSSRIPRISDPLAKECLDARNKTINVLGYHDDSMLHKLCILWACTSTDAQHPSCCTYRPAGYCSHGTGWAIASIRCLW